MMMVVRMMMKALPASVSQQNEEQAAEDAGEAAVNSDQQRRHRTIRLVTVTARPGWETQTTTSNWFQWFHQSEQFLLWLSGVWTRLELFQWVIYCHTSGEKWQRNHSSFRTCQSAVSDWSSVCLFYHMFSLFSLTKTEDRNMFMDLDLWDLQFQRSEQHLPAADFPPSSRDTRRRFDGLSPFPLKATSWIS